MSRLEVRHLRAGDNVKVVAGKERNKQGKVLSIDHVGGRIVVEKVNMVKRHLKPNREHAQGGIVDKEAPLAVSNVMLVCPSCAKPTRVRFTILDDETKVRSCARCAAQIATDTSK